MSTAKDYLQEDMHKRPEQLQQEADDVRADFEHTVDELMNRFSPGELVNQAVSRFRNSGDSAFVNNLSNQIQNNPIPAILAGVSLTWLMSASKQPPARASHNSGPSSSHSSGPSVSEKAGAAKDKLSSATDHARSSGQGLSQSARERGHQVAANASDLRDRASDAGQRTVERARSGFRSARDGYNHLLQEQPLVVGALAIAAGAALGALLPRTSAEDRMVGQTSDEQTQNLKQKAEGFKEQAESKVEENLQKQRSATGSAEQGTTSPERSGATGHRNDGGATATQTRGQATSVSPDGPAAGAAGPPGSAGSVGQGTSETKQGVPVREPATPRDHPDANPPDLNR